MAEVVLDGITKHFGEQTAVDELGLTIGDGELLVLLGPTGAGKTTTLRLVSGLEKPDEGRILIQGRDVTRSSPAERDVAMVFQEYSLYPHYTVYDNLAFPLRSPLRKMDKKRIDAKVREVAALLRIENKLGNRGTALSGGEMQRVAIGRALVRNPAIFLMDEPLSSLDAKLRNDLRVELKRIQISMGATILYVTHDQIEALTLADRIGVFSEGKLLQLGTPQEIYKRPIDTYVACRLGSPGINFLPMGALGVENGPQGAVSFGIRPENIDLDGQGIPTTVRTVEHLGSETIVQLKIDGQEIAALAPPGRTFHKGQQLGLSLRPDSVLFFDANGRRL